MLKCLQAGRAFAALAVLAFHLSTALGDPRYGGHTVGSAYTRHGHFGVDFFFVLSGFIILKAHAGDIGRPDRWRRFAWRRFARIYPIYWIYLAGFCLLLSFGAGQVAHLPKDGPAWVSAFSLVRFSPDETPFVVAWSLFHEIAFYGVFSLLIFNRRLGVAVMAAWFVLCLPWRNEPWDVTFDWWRVYSSPFNLDFFAGMAAYGLYRRGRHPRLLLSLGAVVLVGAIVGAERGDQVASYLFGGGFALAIAGATIAETEGWLPVPSALVTLGAASYSLYLVHVPLMGLWLKFANLSGAAAMFPGWLRWAVVFGAVAASAVLAWAFVEEPLQKLLRFGGRPKPAGAAPAAVLGREA